MTRFGLAQVAIKADIEKGPSLGMVKLYEFPVLLRLFHVDLIGNDGLDQANFGAETGEPNNYFYFRERGALCLNFRFRRNPRGLILPNPET